MANKIQIELNLETEVYYQALKILGYRETTLEAFIELQLRMLINTDSEYQIYHLSDVLPFGQYRGSRLEDIIKGNPKYVAWLCTAAERPITLDYAAQKMLENLMQTR